MNQKLVVIIEIQDGDYTYTFSMPYGSPVGHAYNAAWKCLQEIADIAKKSTEQAAPQEMTMDQFQESIDRANKEDDGSQK